MDEKAKEKKKYIISRIIILIFTLIFIFIITYTGIYYNNKKYGTEQNIELSDVYVKGYNLEPSFSLNNYEYNLAVDQDIIKIACNTPNIKGCNEEIDLRDKSTYTHTIEIDEKNIYTLNIVKLTKEIKTDIKIKSIEGIPTKWTNSDITITVQAESINGIESYSFDGGNSWQTSNKKKIKENTILKILVKDTIGNISDVKEVKIDKIDKEKPAVKIVKEKVSKDQIILKVLSSDNISSVEGISFNNSKYDTKNQFVVKKAGVYSATAKDSAGNISEKVSIEIKNSDFETSKEEPTKIFTATFNQNGSSGSNIYLSCETKENECSINAPAITRNGYIILGWSSDKSSTVAEYKVNDNIKLNENKTYYAITYKKITVKFVPYYRSNLSKNVTCDIYNKNTSCEVDTPLPSKADWEILGWDINYQSKTASIKANSKVSVSSDITYYLISSRKVTAKFIKNGPTTLSSTEQSCTMYNADTSCTIKTPTITAPDRTILGFSNNSNDRVASVGSNKVISISNNVNYYPITMRTVTATFDPNHVTDYLEKTSESCTYYNSDTSCSISFPYFNKLGYFNGYWGSSSEVSSDLSGKTKLSTYFYSVKSSTIITKDTLFYPNFNHKSYTYDKNYYKFKSIPISKYKMLGLSRFEYQSGIPSSAIENHQSFITTVYNTVPQLFIPGKSFIMTKETYTEKSIAYGLTYDSGAYYFIDLQYDPSISAISENATIHELAHAWDSYYRYMTGKGRIKDQSDFQSFYNQLKSKLETNLSDTETFAAMFTNYYWHVLGKNTSKKYYGLSSGNTLTQAEKQTLKTIMEKYLNIAKNGYK